MKATKAVWWFLMLLWCLAVVAMTAAPLWLVFMRRSSPGALGLLLFAAAAGGAFLLYSSTHLAPRAMLLLRAVVVGAWLLSAVALIFGPFWLVFAAGASAWALAAVPGGMVSGGLLLLVGDSLEVWE